MLNCGQTELNINIFRSSYEYIYFCSWGCLVSFLYLQAPLFLQKPKLYFSFSHLFLLIFLNWLYHQIPCQASSTRKLSKVKYIPCQKSIIFLLKVSKVKTISFYNYWHLYILTGHSIYAFWLLLWNLQTFVTKMTTSISRPYINNSNSNVSFIKTIYLHLKQPLSKLCLVIPQTVCLVCLVSV